MFMLIQARQRVRFFRLILLTTLSLVVPQGTYAADGDVKSTQNQASTSKKKPSKLLLVAQSSQAETRRRKKPAQKRKAIRDSHNKPAKQPKGRRPAGNANNSAFEDVFADLKTARSNDRCRPLEPNIKINFDFDGEIKELVETIAKATCKNFILTNKIRSQKFKIVSPGPIRAGDAWRVFLTALQANDFTIVPRGKYYEIIQANEGTRSPVPIVDSNGRYSVNDQMITKIYHIKFGGNPNNIVNYLNIFKSSRGQLHPFRDSNLLVMTDYATSLDRLERLLREIDKPNALEQIHVVPVEYASAAEISKRLTEIFEPGKQNGQPKRGVPKPVAPKLAKKKRSSKRQRATSATTGVVSKIIADERTNKLIIISSEDMFQQVLELMRELDVPGDSMDGQIHVIRLKHADAEELATTLSSLSAGAGQNRGRPRGRPVPRAPNRGGSVASLFEDEVKITADKATNSLVITASKSDLASVRRVVERLDIPRLQVFVEASILEVSTNNDRDLGVGWHAGVPLTLGGETSPLIFSNTPQQNLSSVLNTINPTGLTSLLGLSSALRGPTLRGTEDFSVVPGFNGVPAVGVVLQALQTTSNVNVVSTPHLLTMDNEEAEIQVNEKRPFSSGLTLGNNLSGLAGLAGGTDAAGALGNLGSLGLGQVSINREDVGLTLKIKPQINDEDYVKLEIDQELSDVSGVDPITSQPITSKRSAKTTVVVRSQDSVIIGGLVKDRETQSESKFPLLGDLPLIGFLFKSSNKVVEKVNLILVLTPYIVRTPDDFRKIFERKMAERQEFVELFYGQTEEYRAQIDWSRKVGALASYRKDTLKALMRAENGGPGAPEQTIIRGKEALEPQPQ